MLTNYDDLHQTSTRLTFNLSHPTPTSSIIFGLYFPSYQLPKKQGNLTRNFDSILSPLRSFIAPFELSLSNSTCYPATYHTSFFLITPRSKISLPDVTLACYWFGMIRLVLAVQCTSHPFSHYLSWYSLKPGDTGRYSMICILILSGNKQYGILLGFNQYGLV